MRLIVVLWSWLAGARHRGRSAIIGAVLAACSEIAWAHERVLGAAGHEGQTRKGYFERNGLWSALQTHLQGVDGTTCPVVPEIEIVHVILLSLDKHASEISSRSGECNRTILGRLIAAELAPGGSAVISGHRRLANG
ncbi:hypothetical protein F4V89_15685 [Neorhizobium galegae]|nr:hypothetical protein F4V88_07275 [Neorhizobium galegae]KAB1112860.1 hypothetical protein F4V89_15685 [Neorhizobium galegae]